MKTKIRFISLVVAVMALSACQKESATVNPTYNPDTNTVTAQFVLNVSTGTGKDTKTTADYAQVTGNFLGMDQVHLLAYQLDDNNLGKNGAASQYHFFYNPWVDGKAVPAARDFDLGSLFSQGAVTKDNASRVVELAIPLGTNSVSLYAKATKTTDNYYQGSTIASGDPADLTTLQFALEPLLANKDQYDVGAFFFSSMLTYFVSSGLVNENMGKFWTYASGTTDRSYGFWYPIPEEGVTGFPENPSDQDTAEIGGVTYTYYTGQLSWKQLGTMHMYEVDDKDEPDPNMFVKTAGNGTKAAVYYTLTPLGDVLGEAYYVLTNVVSSGSYKELRAGSASAVLRICEDLYAIMEKCTQATPTSWEEECAKQLATLIKGRMERYFKRYTDGFDFIRDSNGLADVETLLSVLESSTSLDRWNAMKTKVQEFFNVEYFYKISAGNYGFPINVGLPYGAAVMDCTPSWDNQKSMDTFVYVTDIPAYGFGTASFPIASYRYPPELMYYGNSSIRVISSEKKASDFPSSVANWSNEEKWGGWTSGKDARVLASTRSVAMKNTINYGTALLRSEVKFKEDVATTYNNKLHDNNAALHPGESDNEIPINEGGFLVTGIIVGGVADVMGWDFTRYPDNGDYTQFGWDTKDQKYTGLVFTQNGFDKMIYDRVVGGYTVGTSTTPIYTFVWDNYDATKPAEGQSDVYIGVELMNNTGRDFFGELNLIRKSGIFYLLGKLDLKKAVENARANNPNAFKDLSRADYCYPPFNPTNGEPVNAPRVFMQDYMTDATLVLDVDALKHAYITVPDLRASQVSLGLSIDLAWKPGLAFEVEMGKLD